MKRDASGESERMVGKLIAKQRERWVLATKVQDRMIPGDPNSGGLGRKWMMYEIDASDEALIDRLVAPGHSSTPGYTDPKFPVTGRIPRT